MSVSIKVSYSNHKCEPITSIKLPKKNKTSGKCWEDSGNNTWDGLLHIKDEWQYLSYFPNSIQPLIYYSFKIIIFFYAYRCFAAIHESMPGVCLVPWDIRRGLQTFWSYKWLWTTVWLGLKLRSSERAASVLNLRTISPALALPFLCVLGILRI